MKGIEREGQMDRKHSDMERWKRENDESYKRERERE